MTFLAIPVVALEGKGPFASLKRSGTLLKSTWGENLGAQVGFGLLGFVASLPGLIFIGLAVLSGTWTVAVPLGVIGAVLAHRGRGDRQRHDRHLQDRAVPLRGRRQGARPASPRATSPTPSSAAART